MVVVPQGIQGCMIVTTCLSLLTHTDSSLGFKVIFMLLPYWIGYNNSSPHKIILHLCFVYVREPTVAWFHYTLSLTGTNCHLMWSAGFFHAWEDHILYFVCYAGMSIKAPLLKTSSHMLTFLHSFKTFLWACVSGLILNPEHLICTMSSAPLTHPVIASSTSPLQNSLHKLSHTRTHRSDVMGVIKFLRFPIISTECYMLCQADSGEYTVVSDSL